MDDEGYHDKKLEQLNMIPNQNYEEGESELLYKEKCAKGRDIHNSQENWNMVILVFTSKVIIDVLLQVHLTPRGVP